MELLVHGVGGTTPQEMLNDARIERVAGDTTAGIYRRSGDADAEQRPADAEQRPADAERRPADGREEPVREAYVWCDLTSGDSSRALWLVLLPFMVANLAHWMRPSATGRARTVRAYGLIMRLVALSLTVLFTAAACEVALDLTAWQCAGTASCAIGKSWLGFMAPEGGGWWSQPGRRLALAAAVPAAIVALLWFLSHRTWSAYESQQPAGRPLEDDDPAGAGRPALCLPGFWYGRRLVARLRAAHTAAGFLTVAAAISWAASRYDRRPDGDPWLDAAGWWLHALLISTGAFIVYVVCRRGRSETRADDALDRATARALPVISFAVLLLCAVHAAWDRPGWTSSGMLPGNGAFGGIALAQGVLVVGLAVVARALYQGPPAERSPLRGLAGPAVAMLACALGGVLSGGVAQWIADWLDRGRTPGMGEGAVEGPPVVLSWQASIIPVLLSALLLLVLYFVWATRVRKQRLLRTIPDGYPDERPDETRTGAIAGTIARAGLTDAAPWVVGTVSSVTLVLGGVAVAGAWSTQEVPGKAAEGTTGLIEAGAQTAQTLGSWFMGLVFVLLLAWGRRAYRDPSARRTIGILWDVGTFWPRAAHPFAPPCYAERAVPDLTWRMETWTRRTEGRLVISGHSQGSVLAAAAVWQLDRRTRKRVALLTYGCPLERLYGRWFPAYCGPAQLASLHADIHCWRNLWRLTDPIGGPIRLPENAGPEVDRGPLKDPLAYGRTMEHPLPAPILGHSDYQADPGFAEERAALLARLGPPRIPAQPGPAQGSSGRSSE
ncbi:hypothetical protein AB0A77_13615 [Streptomyces varsoviensis]